jgi:hypothetical protein
MSFDRSNKKEGGDVSVVPVYEEDKGYDLENATVRESPASRPAQR